MAPARRVDHDNEGALVVLSKQAIFYIDLLRWNYPRAMVKSGPIRAKNGDMIPPNLDVPHVAAAPVHLEFFVSAVRFVTGLSVS